MNGQYLLHRLIGVLNGCGFTVLFILNPVKHIGGYYPTLTSNYLTKGKADFARHFGIGTRKQIVLVVDQAGWHIGRTSRDSKGHTLGVFAFSLSRITARRAFMDTHE